MDFRNKELSKFLKQKRADIGSREGATISQSEMARRIEIPQGSLSQYENGTRLPNAENADAMAAYLGVEIYDIIGIPRRVPNDPDLVRIVNIWGRLPKNTRTEIADYVENVLNDLED